MIHINEIFYSYQGEGPTVGLPSLFVRFQGCNLSCPFCDTKKTWGASPDTIQFANSLDLFKHIQKQLIDNKCSNVVFTGGEPLLYKQDLFYLISSLTKSHVTCEVETNGTFTFPQEAKNPELNMALKGVQWNVSPKFGTDGISIENLKFYLQLSPHTIFKFVIDTETRHILNDNIKTIKHIIDSLKGEFYDIRDRIYLMPQAATKEEYDKKIYEVYKQSRFLGVKISTRIQVITKNLIP